MADLNDRTEESVKENAKTLYMVEGVAGVMSSVVRMPVDQAFAKLRWFSESQGQELRNHRWRWSVSPYSDLPRITDGSPSGTIITAIARAPAVALALSVNI